MATYTVLKTKEIKALAEIYNIRVKKFQPIKRGNANSNYHLRSRKGEYILTITEERTRKEINRLIELLQWLKLHGFKTSVVVPTKDGKWITQYKGKPVFVKKWIDGKVDPSLSAKQLKEIGRALAMLHTIDPPPYLYKEHGYGMELFPNIQGLNLDKDYESWLKKQHKQLDETLSRDLPKGIIHGDLFFDNVIFRRKKLQAIIDFEEACHYYLAFDLGMAIVGLCKNKRGDKINWRKASILVKAYNGERSLNDLELTQLQLCIEYAATATSFWRFRQYHINRPTPELMAKKWEMVNVAKQAGRVSKRRFRKLIFG